VAIHVREPPGNNWGDENHLITENSEKLFSPIIKSIAYENTRYQESMAYRLFQSFQLITTTKTDSTSGLQARPGDLVFPALPGHQNGKIVITPGTSPQVTVQSPAAFCPLAFGERVKQAGN
jgi:hypothetical protein